MNDLIRRVSRKYASNREQNGIGSKNSLLYAIGGTGVIAPTAIRVGHAGFLGHNVNRYARKLPASYQALERLRDTGASAEEIQRAIAKVDKVKRGQAKAIRALEHAKELRKAKQIFRHVRR